MCYGSFLKPLLALAHFATSFFPIPGIPRALPFLRSKHERSLCGGERQSPILILYGKEKDFLMVTMDSGIVRRRERTTTTESRNLAAKHQIYADRDLKRWFTVQLFDIGYPCYAQLTPVHSRYLCPYSGLKSRAHRGHVCFYWNSVLLLNFFVFDCHPCWHKQTVCMEIEFRTKKS